MYFGKISLVTLLTFTSVHCADSKTEIKYVNGYEIRPNSQLKGANLTGANLSGVILIGVKLSRTNLTDVILSGANLNSADLSEANLIDANLNDIKANNLRGCPSSLPKKWVCDNNSLKQF
mgnify:CR=1 FL=1